MDNAPGYRRGSNRLRLKLYSSVTTKSTGRFLRRKDNVMNENTYLANDESRELTSHVASMAPIKDGKPAIEDGCQIDDQGTNQEDAAQILRNLRDNAFDGD